METALRKSALERDTRQFGIKRVQLHVPKDKHRDKKEILSDEIDALVAEELKSNPDVRMEWGFTISDLRDVVLMRM